MTNNTTLEESYPESGYDLEVYGIKTGEFLQVHITALTCMAAGLLSSFTIGIMTLRKGKFVRFFSLTKGERFVIYLTVCHLVFNISHSMDHAHYLIVRDHVHPKWLCTLYGFLLLALVLVQVFMANLIAFSAFILIKFQKNMNFGRNDWRMLLYTFGIPLVLTLIAFGTDQLGPTGAFCGFDGVKGYIGNVLLQTTPMVMVTVINSVLYVLTWRCIRQESKRISSVIGRDSATAKSLSNAAKSMTLFVAAFFVQWWATSIYGVWKLFEHSPPIILMKLVTTFANLGGVFNGIVYLLIHRRQKAPKTQGVRVTGNNRPAVTRARPHVEDTTT